MFLIKLQPCFRFIAFLVILSSIFLVERPLHSYFESETSPSWRLKIMNSTLLWDKRGGTFDKLPETTYATFLNYIHFTDPNLFGVNNLKIDGETINFFYWEGDLGYWGFLNYNLALGLSTKFHLFQNGWLILKDTYNTFTNPNDPTEVGEFNGNQYSGGPFIAFTPTDNLTSKWIYRFSYQHYSFTTEWPKNFIRPEPHFTQYFEHFFNWQGHFSPVWDFHLKNKTTYTENFSKDHYFGYRDEPHKMDWQFYNKVDFKVGYRHYNFIQNFTTGVFFSRENEFYLGKSVFKFLDSQELSLLGNIPKSIPAYSAWIMNLDFRTDRLLNNFVNIAISGSVALVDDQKNAFLKNPSTFIGGEFGLVFDPEFVFFKQVAIISYSVSYNINNEQTEQIVSFYVSPK